MMCWRPSKPSKIKAGALWSRSHIPYSTPYGKMKMEAQTSWALSLWWGTTYQRYQRPSSP